MNISDIYVHDAQLHRVIEDIEANTVTMEVDLPILERDEEQEPRLLVFDGAYNYQVFEQPWHGLITILDMDVVAEQGRSKQVRIETNAGYREVFCTAVRVCNHDKVALPCAAANSAIASPSQSNAPVAQIFELGPLPPMNAPWTPISPEELRKEIDNGVAKMSPGERVLWRMLRITPQKWKLSPWGDKGGGFWVVAVGGDKCIYYNDIEDGFNVSQFTQHGVIAHYWCNQDELQWAIHRLEEVSNGSCPANAGPPAQM